MRKEATPIDLLVKFMERKGKKKVVYLDTTKES